MRFLAECATVGGGEPIIWAAVDMYQEFGIWSPKIRIVVSGELTIWTMRPACNEHFDGVVAFRPTAEGGQLILIERTIDGYHLLPGVYILTNAEYWLVVMDGARCATLALRRVDDLVLV